MTLFIMRPAGREQIKRIDDKIRYSNHSSSLLTNFMSELAPALKGEVWMKLCKDVKLRICEFDGMGELLVADSWEEKDALFRADVLKDWIEDLTCLYSDALTDMGMTNETGVLFIEMTEEYYAAQRGEL